MKGHKNAKKLIFVKYLYFLNPITLNRFVFDITMRQISTFSRASETLFWVTVFPATPKTLSLLLLATGIAKTTDGSGDDDDYDDNDDDGDDDDGICLRTCKNPWQ